MFPYNIHRDPVQIEKKILCNARSDLNKMWHLLCCSFYLLNELCNYHCFIRQFVFLACLGKSLRHVLCGMIITMNTDLL